MGEEQNDKTNQPTKQGNKLPESIITTESTISPDPTPGTAANPTDQKSKGIKTKFRALHIPLPVLIFSIFFALLLLLIFATYAVAYEKIEIKALSKIQPKIAGVVMEIPFMPKTPKFLLGKALQAHEQVTSYAFDFSIAARSTGFSELLGTNNFDFQVKGEADFKDTKNILAQFNLSAGNLLDADFIKTRDKLFFKLNKLPTELLSLTGPNSEFLTFYIDKWVRYEIFLKDTEARSILDEEKDSALTQKELGELGNKLSEKRVSEAITILDSKEDGFETYKLTLKPNDELLDYIMESLMEADGSVDSNPQTLEKTSEFMKNMNIEISIDKKDYYIRKSAVSFDLVTKDLQNTSVTGSFLPGLSSSDLSMVVVGKFSDFGKKVEPAEPAESIRFEEFLLSINESLGLRSFTPEGYVHPTYSSDVVRTSDLAILSSASEFYRQDCGFYPENLNTLAKGRDSDTECAGNSGPYLTSVPKDPDGTDYYYQRSSDKQSFDLCAALIFKVPNNTAGPCPDSRYNLHLTPEKLMN